MQKNLAARTDHIERGTMNELELASELPDVYKSGLKNGTATAEAVLFGIRRASDILVLPTLLIVAQA